MRGFELPTDVRIYGFADCYKRGSYRYKTAKIRLVRLLGKGFDRQGFVVLHILYVEDGEEFGDLEKVMNLLGEVEQLEFAALIADGGERADQLADARAVDVGDFAQVQQYLLFVLVEQITDLVAQHDAAFMQDDASAQIQNGDPVNVPSACFHCHCCPSVAALEDCSDASPRFYSNNLGRVPNFST